MSLEEQRAYNRKTSLAYYYRNRKPGPGKQKAAKLGETIICRKCDEPKIAGPDNFYCYTGGTFGRVCKACYSRQGSDSIRRAKFKLTREQYEILRVRPCVLCGSTHRTAFDHCHATGRFRNVLCQACNTGLGFFRDRPDLLRLAAQYVEHYATVHAAGT